MPDAAAATDDALVSTFGRLLEAAARLERRLGTALEAETGVPHVWFEVLVRLARSERGMLPMGELAGQITLTSGGVTRLVDRMDAAGLVTRQACATDRRVSYAAITDAGRAKLAEAVGVHATNLRTVFDGFSDRELAVLDRLLDRLRGAPLPA
ncbi:MarR family transcriptional regulator [Geodermatophilus sp. YIM 151500]|uniref:MarR family winged helix-turn-helix transcriptional regulator n=1 Tax=Geodermatophilus sp. YIM 151500 TaxID=2984531 RepID=UPI0021E3B24F|nr:MarR family transcriptional regulator [Geodermatophilus sp. YIM 151500]MCV2491145.1 MarR family transcriptional regulator [Geodermatophilus sp. YIM 151500]